MEVWVRVDQSELEPQRTSALSIMGQRIHNGSECVRADQNIRTCQKRVEMNQSGSEWIRAVQNGSESVRGG